jgi:hypothetical protein
LRSANVGRAGIDVELVGSGVGTEEGSEVTVIKPLVDEQLR